MRVRVLIMNLYVLLKVLNVKGQIDFIDIFFNYKDYL